eukprot:jgi/Mesen1/143/ME1130027C07694
MLTGSPSICATSTSAPRATTAARAARSARACSTSSAPTSSAWWWPRWPLAWGWTRATSARWCTTTCRAA